MRYGIVPSCVICSPMFRCALSRHDTSIPMIERNYSKYIADHADVLSRRAMLDPDAVAGHDVISLPQR